MAHDLDPARAAAESPLGLLGDVAAEHLSPARSAAVLALGLAAAAAALLYQHHTVRADPGGPQVRWTILRVVNGLMLVCFPAGLLLGGSHLRIVVYIAAMTYFLGFFGVSLVRSVVLQSQPQPPAPRAAVRPRGDKLRVLSFNVFCRPAGISTFNRRGADMKSARLAQLEARLGEFDVVVLQELFEFGSTRRARVIRAAREAGLCYHSGLIRPSWLSWALVDAGLLVLSRYPIVEHDDVAFPCGLGADACALKGAAYARVRVPSADGRRAADVHVVTSHTQAGEAPAPAALRWQQLRLLARLVRRKVAAAPGDVVIAGDFNLDALHEAGFDGEFVPESGQYRDMMGLLGDACGGAPLVDVARAALGVHPITTYGHGEIASPDDKPPAVLRCIDYVLWAPADARRAAELEAAVSPMRAEPSHARFRQLSDHMGIVAELPMGCGPVAASAAVLPAVGASQGCSLLWQLKPGVLVAGLAWVLWNALVVSVGVMWRVPGLLF